MKRPRLGRPRALILFLKATRTRKIRMFNIHSHTPDIKQIDAADVRFRRKVRRLLGRGDRLIVEMLAELGADRLIATIIDQMLDRYLALPDEALDATGAHDFPPVTIHGVRR